MNGSRDGSGRDKVIGILVSVLLALTTISVGLLGQAFNNWAEAVREGTDRIVKRLDELDKDIRDNERRLDRLETKASENSYRLNRAESDFVECKRARCPSGS